MSISLIDAIDLVRKLTGLPIHSLPGAAELAQFCARHRFHPAQEQLTPKALGRVLDGLAPHEMLLLTDRFRIRFILAEALGSPVVFGPYCTEVITETDLPYLVPESIRRSFPAGDLLAYRSRFPVFETRQALHYARTTLRHADGLDRTVRSIHLSPGPQEVAQQPLLSRAEIIEERYRIEQQMVEHIKAGRAAAAVECYNTMEQGMAYVKRIGNTLERSRVGAAIVRTTVRHAAFRAGLPAILIDKLSTENTVAVEQAADLPAIRARVEDMIRSFCAAIYQKNNQNYSKLVLCMIYSIEHNYQKDLSVADLAEELEVSVDYLIKCSKKETGLTPNAYIRKVRMTHAAQLLRESPRSVQQISAEVGILDANYFTKLFRAEFGATPSAYRANRML